MEFVLTFPVKRHRCFMCLKSEKDEESTSFAVSDRLRPFGPLLDYLVGEGNERRRGWSSLEETVPPVCIACFDILGGLYDLHVNLVDVQRKIQVQTEIARSVVRRSIGGIQDGNEVVTQMREEIMKNYNREVTFPRRLPPSTTPSPPPRAVTEEEHRISPQVTPAKEEPSGNVVWIWRDPNGQLITSPTILLPNPALSPPEPTSEQTSTSLAAAASLPSSPCDVCSLPIPKPFHSSHLASHVSPDYIFSCNSCQLSFLTPFRLHAHHQALQTPCPSYSPSFIKAFLQCSLCSLHFPNIHSLKSHLPSHSSSPLVLRCPLCPSKFSCKSSILFHLQSSHIANYALRRLEPCSVCSRSLPVADLESHYLHTHELPPEKLFKCRLCPFTHTSVNGVIEHQRRAFKRKLHKISCHQCKICGFKDLTKLRQHYLVKHQVRDRFRCRRCHAVFHSVDIYPTDELTCQNIREEELADLSRSICWKFRCEKCANINLLTDDQ